MGGDDTRRRWARVVGVAVIAAGLVGCALLWWSASRRYDRAVADLAPAPAGCDTTLIFDRSGMFTFFLETAGSVGEIDGDCVLPRRADEDVAVDEDEVGDVQLTLVDSGGEDVDLDRVDGPSYDRDGRRGVGFRTAEIDDEGVYVLTVEADNPAVVVRVGRDPAAGVAALRTAAIAVLVAGVAFGVLALVLARRRPIAIVEPVAEQWPQRAACPPVAPPTVVGPRPPYTAPGGRPLPPPTVAPPTPPQQPALPLPPRVPSPGASQPPPPAR